MLIAMTRFGSALNLNIHFHILFLDGVYVYRDNRPPRFKRVKAPAKDELEDLVQLISRRVGRCLERQGLLEQDAESAWLDLDPAEDTDAMPQILGSSVSYRIAVGPQQGRKAFMIRTIRPLDRPDPGLERVIGMPVSLRAFGRWGVRISDPRSFLTQIVGGAREVDYLKLKAFFIGDAIQGISQAVSDLIVTDGVSILQLSQRLEDLSATVREGFKLALDRVGVELVAFIVENINLPPEELDKIQEVYGKSFEARELSNVDLSSSFSTIKSFEVMNSAAENPSDSGMGALLDHRLADVRSAISFRAPEAAEMLASLALHRPATQIPTHLHRAPTQTLALERLWLVLVAKKDPLRA